MSDVAVVGGLFWQRVRSGGEEVVPAAGGGRRGMGRIFGGVCTFSRRQGWPPRLFPFTGAPRPNLARWVRTGKAG